MFCYEAKMMRAIIAAPSTLFLRALPVARWQLFVPQGTLLVIAELPWSVLRAVKPSALHPGPKAG
jgi:hypothetical protein